MLVKSKPDFFSTNGDVDSTALPIESVLLSPSYKLPVASASLSSQDVGWTDQ